MSLTTWKKEFYKVPAKRKMTEVEAIEHSILKWTGLRKENLEKHDLGKSHKDLCDVYGNEFQIDDSSCALCVKHLNSNNITVPRCKDCPLYMSLGYICDSGSLSPYRIWLETGDPNPMIKALKKALKLANKE